MDESPVEVVEAIVGFHGDGFFELCQGVIDLIEHHHTVASIGIVLWIFLIKANGSSEIIHGFLIVPSGHEGISSISMILGVQ